MGKHCFPDDLFLTSCQIEEIAGTGKKSEVAGFYIFSRNNFTGHGLEPVHNIT